MAYRTILLHVEGGIARLTLNRPDRLNAFSVEMHEELRDALSLLKADPDLRVLVLTGAGKAFCSGQDLGERAAVAAGGSIDLGDSIEKYYKPLVLALRELPFPVLAAVNGVAAGSGANVALGCDIVIASKSASFLQPFAKLGLMPDAGGTWIIPRLVGPARAFGLTFLGDKLTAEDAERYGLIWQCVDEAHFQRAVESCTQRLASTPTLALARTKQAINECWGRTLEEQLDVERDMQRELGRTADYVEGIAAFIEKRPARFHGR